MKERRKKGKKQAPAAAAESRPAQARLAERVQAFAASPQGRYGIPLAILLVTLLVGAWTFDPKLSLSGDNTEFISLARSLAQGEGLSHINSPDPQPATKYPFAFPLMLAPLVWLSPDGWVPMKWLVLMLFALAMPVFYWLAKERLGVLPALCAVALCLTTGSSYLTTEPGGHIFGPLLLHYAHQVMSEVPYLTFSLLGLLLVERGAQRAGLARNYWLIGGFACVLWAYYIRSVGLVLVAAMLVYLLLLRRDYRRTLILGIAAFALWLPWTLRNRAVGGGGVYFKQLLMVNPYYPDQGMLDFGGLVERIASSSTIYLTKILPATLVPSFEATGSFLNPVSLLLIGLMVYAAVLCITRRQDLLLFVYAVFFLGTVVLWPWQGDRFLVPIVPLLIFFAIRVVMDLVDRLEKFDLRWVGTTAALVVFAWMLAGNGSRVRNLAEFTRSDYPPAWRNYYQAGQWLRTHAPEGAVVLCRKGYWMYIVSGRPCAGFPFEAPEAVVAHMEREQVDFVVVESLGFRQTRDFLVPAINAHPERFQVLWQRSDPPTYILRFLRQD